MADALNLLGAEQEQVPAPEPARSHEPLAVASLVLGLLGPVTLGVTALPGICCGLLSFVRGCRSKMAVAGVVLSGASLVVPVLVYREMSGSFGWTLSAAIRSQAAVRDEAMAQVGLPPLPTSATAVQFETRTLRMHTNGWLRFKASSADCQAFIAESGELWRRPLDEVTYQLQNVAPKWFDWRAASQGWFMAVPSQSTVRLVYDTERHEIYVFWIVAGGRRGF